MFSYEHASGDKPPSPPRLRSTDLPDDADFDTNLQNAAHDPFLSGYPILPEDMDLGDLPQDEVERRNIAAIKESREASGTQVPVGELQDISFLREEYSESSKFFCAQIDHVRSQGYDHIRRVTGDGNCFYRALAFAYTERLMHSSSSNKLAQLEEPATLLEPNEVEYCEGLSILRSLVKLNPKDDPSASDELTKVFRDKYESDCIVWYLRTLTSARIRRGGFEHFLAGETGADSEGFIDAETFCRTFVNCMGIVADSVHVAALAQALNVYVKVAHLDGHDSKVVFHTFPHEEVPDGQEPLALLYRPGHYDILQKKA